jgi:hypothetical protein
VVGHAVHVATTLDVHRCFRVPSAIVRFTPTVTAVLLAAAIVFIVIADLIDCIAP